MRERFHCSGAAALHPYSLVEMLMVLAIIAILVGLGAGGYTVARRWLSQSRTEALLSKLKIAIESYKNDKGYYPLPHTAPSTAESAVPIFRLDVNAKDFTSGTPTECNIPRNNMNNFIDYSKIQMDQSFKFNYSNCNYYYVKDGWNAPLVTAVTLIGGSTTDKFGAIKYRCPGVINTTSFDLYSAGYDRKFASNPATDTKDDIYAK